MKKCRKCKIDKEIKFFHKNNRAKDGHSYYCKECAKVKNTLWAIANSEKRKFNQRAYYKRNANILKEKKAKYRDTSAYKEEHKKYRRVHTLKKRGLTKETYDKKLLDQNNSCAICEKEFNTKIRPVIDHCHTHKHTRGILCIGCNASLGHIEREGFLDKALIYIDKYKKYKA